MGRLENKVALITGVASGIGSATAQRFAEEGALIAGLDLNTPGGPTWEKIRATAKGCSFYTADVSNEKDVKSAVAAAKKKFGRIDVLVNDLVIIEIKSVDALADVHHKQLLTYLKLSGKKLGLLINFNVVFIKESIIRIVNNL